MASKHLWIAELQDRDGKAVEYHSVELEEEHYASRADFNRAMTSWSAFRQRERGNLKVNRPKNSRCKWACSWMTPDSITFYLDGVPEMPLHKTIWDLYEAIGYNYKAKKYERLVVIAHDPSPTEPNIAEVTFGKGIPLKVRQITSNHGCKTIPCDAEAEKFMHEEPKRMRGDTPGIVMIDESGFMDKQGNPIYVASSEGKTEFLVSERTPSIPEKIGVIATSSNVETATVTERVALGSGMVAEPASLEEANRLRAKVGLDPLFAQPIPEISDPGFAQETEQVNDPGFVEEVVHEVEYPAIKNPFNGANITEAQARAIADRVNAEPDINAKKRILKDQLQHYASEREGVLEAEKIRIRMPGDNRNDPKVIAHKRSVVKSYQKLKRQQAKAEKMKALQVKAFSGK